jgi:dinuclear metal center YbgI/SA1388 family protein
VTTVKDIIGLMDQLAPARLAQEWDNCGIQCGNPDATVNRAVVALDPSPDVVKAACDQGATLLITHHPLIFRPVKNMVLNTPLGRVIEMAVSRGLTIFAAHTNLDSVQGGLNDRFAEIIGLQNVRLLTAETDSRFVKLAVYVPESAFQPVFDAILETDAGLIGSYSGCTFRQKGIGTFVPGNDTRPFTGKPGRLESVEELRIEMRVPEVKATTVLEHIRRHHPYEVMAYDIYSLYPETDVHGIGRVGEFKTPLTLTDLSEKLKQVFGLIDLRVSGPRDRMISKAALCTGSGAGLMKAFFASDADVYISGDLKFHDAKDAQMQDRTLIDIGHFASEIIMTDLVAVRLTEMIREKGWNVTVTAHKNEEDPFYTV